eukprot:4880463-Pyramimonas_sp.AAC.1
MLNGVLVDTSEHTSGAALLEAPARAPSIKPCSQESGSDPRRGGRPKCGHDLLCPRRAPGGRQKAEVPALQPSAPEALRSLCRLLLQDGQT